MRWRNPVPDEFPPSDVLLRLPMSSKTYSNCCPETGVPLLKYFFNSGLSTSEGDFVASESVKNRIREIIEKEDTKKPLSDQKIAEMLSVETVNIARRTVTKYREVLKLGSSSERKRHF